MIDPSKILSQLEQLDARLIEAIKRILDRNPSNEQLLQFLATEQFDDLINELGLEKIVSDYVSGFDTSFKQDIANFGRIDLTAQEIQRIENNINIIKNSNGRTVLGYAKANSDLLRVKLINSIINGETARTTVKELEGKLISDLTNTPLSTSQIGSVISTSYADFSRSTTAQVFKNKPEQRFYYEGGILPTSSDECQWLMQNQKSEGYTKAEIDAGIETPFTHTSGPLRGQKKMIYWTGRQPNYNCIHQWMPVELLQR